MIVPLYVEVDESQGQTVAQAEQALWNAGFGFIEAAPTEYRTLEECEVAVCPVPNCPCKGT